MYVRFKPLWFDVFAVFYENVAKIDVWRFSDLREKKLVAFELFFRSWMRREWKWIIFLKSVLVGHRLSLGAMTGSLIDIFPNCLSCWQLPLLSRSIWEVIVEQLLEYQSTNLDVSSLGPRRLFSTSPRLPYLPFPHINAECPTLGLSRRRLYAITDVKAMKC